MNSENQIYADLCISCGKPIPEGRMVCRACEAGENRIAPYRTSKLSKGIRRIVDLIKGAKK